MKNRRELLAAAVCVAFASLCLAYTLILPPYEGFDEGPHYSYISCLVDRRQIPDFRYTLADQAVSDAVDHLPRPYGTTVPFEANGSRTYGDFFNRTSVDERQAAVHRFWEPPDRPTEYAPANGPTNWLGQHPPLFYALMGLPYHCIRSASPGVRLLLLRLCCVLLTCGSLVFWWKSLRLFESTEARRTMLLGGIAVLWFPSCWFDLGRLGNDSLVALLASATFYFALRACRNRHQRMADHLAIAVTLGLGLLTKAFFLPFYAGMIAWFLWQTIVRDRLSWKAWSLRLLVLLVVPVLISAPWYLFYWQRYGSPLGTRETYYWLQAGAARPGDSYSTLSFAFNMLRAMAACVKSFLWCGTWSYMAQPRWHFVLCMPWLLLMAGNAVFRRLRKADSDSRQIALTAAMLLMPLAMSFVHYLYWKGRAVGFPMGVGGYYFFTAWVPLAVYLGCGLDATASRAGRIATFLALGLVAYVELSGIWLSAETYAGIVEKLGDLDTGIGHVWPTPAHLALVYSRLQEIVFPAWAAIFYGISWAVRLPLLIAVLSAPDGGPPCLTPELRS